MSTRGDKKELNKSDDIAERHDCEIMRKIEDLRKKKIVGHLLLYS